MITVVHQEDERTCVRSLVQENMALYVAIEMPGPVTKLNEVSALLSTSVKQLASWGKGTPSALAKAVDFGLRGLGATSDSDEWVFFVAVLAMADAVEVCASGPFRIHLVQRGEIRASTREHILRCDPPLQNGQPTSNIDLEVHGGVVTRSLGDPRSRPPETTIWKVDAPYEVIVCSSDFHRDREPGAYIEELADLGGIKSGRNEGTVAVIEYA